MFRYLRKRSNFRRLLRQRSGFERLEDRRLLAVFTVNVTTDNGPDIVGEGIGNVGDLRYAIAQATLNPGLKMGSGLDLMSAGLDLRHLIET